MKKLFVTLFAAMLSAGGWAYDAQIDGIYYDFNTETKEATVTFLVDDDVTPLGNENAYSGDVVIPETVTYDGTTYTVTSIGRNAIFYCTGVTSISIPNTVTTIGDYAAGFCNINSITIPDAVTSIGEGAFGGCMSMTSLTIGSSVESIGYYAFATCPKLERIDCNTNNAPASGGKIFFNTSMNRSVYANAELHVPVGSKENYSAADDWKNFANIIEDLEPTGISSIHSECNDNSPRKYIENGKVIIEKANRKYTLSGQRTE